MAREYLIPLGIRNFVEANRQSKEREIQGQAAIDQALTTAVNLLREHGEAAAPTEGNEKTPSNSQNYSIEPNPLDGFSYQIKGKLRQTGYAIREPIYASVEVNVIGPKSDEFPNGRTTQSFFLRGPLKEGNASKSHVMVDDKLITDPKLMIQYRDTMKLIDDKVRNRPQPSN